jgi:hypothetical protein
VKAKLAFGFVSGLLAFNASAQGTISFKNLNSSPAFNAPVYLSDGTTRAAGSQYVAWLMAGTTANNLALVPGVPTPFLTGGAAGYFSGGVVTMPGIPGGSTAFIQVIFWNLAAGATFPFAQGSSLGDSWGESSVFSVVTADPSATPPTPPAFLAGLGTRPLIFVGPAIPEPSTWAMFNLAIVASFFLRRRSN